MINTILNLLRTDGYITVNKTLACNIGLVPATIFSELASKFNYFNNRDQLRDGYFYCTSPDLKKNTGLSKDEQSTAIKKLIKFGLIEMQVKKLKGDEAPMRYFKIVADLNNLLKYLTSIENSGKEENPISNNGIPLFESVIPSTNKNNIIISNMKEISPSVRPDFIETPKETKVEVSNFIENTDDRPTDSITLEKEVKEIIINAQVELYDSKNFLESVIRKLYTDSNMPYTLKMGLTHSEIQERLKLLAHMHIDRGLFKLGEAQKDKGVKNKELYFAKCLLTSIVEAQIDFLGLEEDE